MKNLIESKWNEILSLLETQYDISNVLITTFIKPSIESLFTSSLKRSPDDNQGSFYVIPLKIPFQ